MTSVPTESERTVTGMAEYIERDALMLRIKEIHCAECDSYNGVRCRACLVDDTLDYIDSEPAADVAPVVHGRWEYEVPTINTYGMVKCTVCNWWTIGPFVSTVYNYCPNCGARMAEDIDEQKK